MSQRRSNQLYSFNIKNKTALLPFLLQAMDQGRNRTKSMLKRGQILVDQKVETRHNRELKPGQVLTVLKHALPQKTENALQIIYEDEYLLVVNKSAGLLTIASSKENHVTAYRQLTEHVKQQHPKNRIFIVHRLDRDTSGIMLFAKTETVKRAFQDNWKQMIKKRQYTAVIEGKMQHQEQTMTSWLKETSTHKMYATREKSGGKKAILRVKQRIKSKRYSLVEIELETGRKNQIRAQMEEVNTPIVGDKKYGALTNPIGRLALHANLITFIHPIHHRTLQFTQEVPASFYQLVKE